MKKLLLLGLITLFLNAEQLIIDANNFEANDAKGISKFTGNVKLSQGKDRLKADKLEVYITKKIEGKKREPVKYIATGNVEFKIFSNGKEYEGKGKKVIYKPKEFQYSIFGDGYLKEKNEDKTLYGDEIIISKNTGEAKIKGSADKPVRFILNIDSSADQEKAPQKDTTK